MDSDKIVLSLNAKASEYLRKDNTKHAHRCLKQAEKLIVSAPDSLKATTLNNFGCYWKRMHEPRRALNYLEAACTYEKDDFKKAGILLNICAIWSSLGEHSFALESGEKAISILETANRTSNLIIAYHNVAVEYEYLNKTQEALSLYSKAYETAAQALGVEHPLTENMLKSLQNVGLTDGKKKKKRIELHLKAEHLNFSVYKRRDKDLFENRFLTGGRMQPMFQHKQRRFRSIFTPSQTDNNRKIHKLSMSEKRKTAEIKPIGKPKLFKIKNDLDQKKDKLEIKKEDLVRTRNNLSRNKQPVANNKDTSEAKKQDSDNIRDFNRVKEEFEKYKDDVREIEDTMNKKKRENQKKNNYLDKILEAKPDKSPKEDTKEKKETWKSVKISEDAESERSVRSASRAKRETSRLPILQASLRAYNTRAYYKMLSDAAVIIQKNVKGHQCRELFKDIKNAVIYIQQTYRIHREYLKSKYSSN